MVEGKSGEELPGCRPLEYQLIAMAGPRLPPYIYNCQSVLVPVSVRVSIFHAHAMHLLLSGRHIILYGEILIVHTCFRE